MGKLVHELDAHRGTERVDRTRQLRRGLCSVYQQTVSIDSTDNDLFILLNRLIVLILILRWDEDTNAVMSDVGKDLNVSSCELRDGTD